MALLSSPPPWPYPLLCPLAPRKGSWLADKVKRLMRPRREGGLHGGPRLWADGAGSTESLGGPPEMELSEGREADGTGGSGGQVTRTVPTPCPLPSLRHLLTPPVSSSFCCLHSCLCRPCLLHLPQVVPVGLCSASLPHPSCLAPSCHLPLPPTESYPPTAVPRTSEQQGTLVRGRLFQSADEETGGPGRGSVWPKVTQRVSVRASTGSSLLFQPSLTQTLLCPCDPFFLPLGSFVPILSRRVSTLLGPSVLRSHSPCCPCLLQGPLPRRPCAGPRAPSACEMRPWQAGSGGSSAPDSQWGAALNRSALGTPPGSDSDSAGRAPHLVPVAKVRDGAPCLPRPPTFISPQTLLGLCSFTRCRSTPCGAITYLPGEGASLLFPVSPHKPCPPPPWSLWPSSCLVPPARLGRGMGRLHRDPGGTRSRCQPRG